MAFAPVRDRGAIATKGGGIIKIKEVLEDGADLSTTASVYDLGYLQETTFRDNTPETPINDETGDQVQTDIGNREVMVEGVLQQSDKNILDIAKETRGKVYALYKYNGVKNGKHQEVWFGVGKINPSFEVKYAGGTVPFKFTAMKNPSAITLASGVGSGPIATPGNWGGYASGAITISANGYYEIVETAV